jgi:hypothetical protein
LLTRVVVVEVPHKQEMNMKDEIRILFAIRQQTGSHEGGSHYVELVDYAPGWLVMSTQPVCCDMATLCERLEVPMPRNYALGKRDAIIERVLVSAEDL